MPITRRCRLFHIGWLINTIYGIFCYLNSCINVSNQFDKYFTLIIKMKHTFNLSGNVVTRCKTEIGGSDSGTSVFFDQPPCWTRLQEHLRAFWGRFSRLLTSANFKMARLKFCPSSPQTVSKFSRSNLYVYSCEILRYRPAPLVMYLTWRPAYGSRIPSRP